MKNKCWKGEFDLNYERNLYSLTPKLQNFVFMNRVNG